MAVTLAYTQFEIGDVNLHQIHTRHGKMFVMGEVAQRVFQESPTAFLNEMRGCKHARVFSDDDDVLATIAELGLPVEVASSPGQGIMLLPAASVGALLLDRRRPDLVQPFQLALLKTYCQESTQLMSAGEYEATLPLTLEAVQLGQKLFKPAPAVQMFPLYLLAAQANLGLRRVKQCDEFLALASLLVTQHAEDVTHAMRSQLNRCYGQMYASQGRTQDAIYSFAEDVYHSSCEWGPQNVRSSHGFYSLAKCFQAAGELDKALAFSDELVSMWALALETAVLGLRHSSKHHEPGGAGDEPGVQRQNVSPSAIAPTAAVPVAPEHEDGTAADPVLLPGPQQLREVVDMLADIASLRASCLGEQHPSVADVSFVQALALQQLQQGKRALQCLDQAASIYGRSDAPYTKLLTLARQEIGRSIAVA